jgi:hypothetical protein
MIFHQEVETAICSIENIGGQVDKIGYPSLVSHFRVILFY